MILGFVDTPDSAYGVAVSGTVAYVADFTSGLQVIDLSSCHCPWDCADFDRGVGINDLLVLLAQWGQIGVSCDFEGDGVGIVDFLELLANWGPCP